jgi:hypothetical protein
MKEFGTKNIQRITELLGVDLETVKIALGIATEESQQLMKEIEAANTIQKIRAVYEKIPTRCMLKRLALEKWNFLSVEAIREASTLEQIRAKFPETPADSRARELVLKKWICFATTIEEVVEAGNKAPIDSEAKELAIKKLRKIMET